MLDLSFVDGLVDNIVQKLEAHAVRLEGANVDWRALFEMHRASLRLCDSESEREERLNGILARSGLSHAQFFSDNPSKLPDRMAIAATTRAVDFDEGPRWMFQDVHPDGPADRAGIRPGDLLLAVSGSPVIPPLPLMLPVTTDLTLLLQTSRGKKEVVVSLESGRFNGSASGTPPMIVPRSVTSERLGPDIGYIRVAFFPGASGRQFAAELEKAFRDLGPYPRRLIVDLRGNAGGFVGSLRLASHFTPHRMPMGYSLTRQGQDRGLSKERLMRLRRIPNGRLGELLMYVRFRYFYKDRSVSLWTEGLGPRPFHDRIVLLVNEHSHSAAEMVAAFAYEERVATLVGVKTAGWSLGGATHRVAERYLLRLPASVWYTWRGTSYEGRGIPPNVEVAQDPLALHNGADTQLEAAKHVVKAM
jgi:carboxyl-terminal processing protease